MSLNIFKLVFIFILVSFLKFPITEGENPGFIYNFCSSSENITSSDNTYQENVLTLFSSLSSNAPLKNFYNNTVHGSNTSSTVYGLFMCRGDVPSQLCEQCVQNATQELSSLCYLSTWAIIWYDQCMVRYSSTSNFFSTADTSFTVYMWNIANVSNPASFMPVLADTLDKTATVAAFSHIVDGRYYATKEANVSGFQTLYCLAQCTEDLSPRSCRECLLRAKSQIQLCCENKRGGRVLLPSCNIRYESAPFYLSKEDKAPETQDAGYLSHNCSIDKINDRPFQQKISTLLSHLSSNASVNNNVNGLSMSGIDGTVFGLYMCRPDISPPSCGQCISNAAQVIASECPSSVEAIVWYDHCLLRYSNKYFFHKMSQSPRYDVLSVTNVNNDSSFKVQLSGMLTTGSNEIRASDRRYWTKSSTLYNNQTLYILAQCTLDLSGSDCSECIFDIVGSAWYRLGSVGGRVLYPSCTLRFELFKFYGDNIQYYNPSPPPLSPRAAPERKSRLQTIILIVVPTVISVTLFSFFCYWLWKKARKNYKTILKENFGPESTTVESLQFDLAIIKEATNNFAYENRIGIGGFGEVYKGVLLDGRDIAVKRLSTSSKQGVDEFKNEVLLIARLQHRNLVAFIGFCLEEQDKILIYEYVPNKSLDYFIFDAQSEKKLNWHERHKIIGGIARGILYLHEYSRLKVIHRDLKPSNVLLDENMNPKISDFGLARIVEIDQQQASTNKIVGTLGYMSPEYRLLGEFSEKSDVFSFGVMVLEIVAGRKNVASYETHRIPDYLVSLVWRQYRDQTPLNILDPKLKEKYSEFEVTRCIQIGLLCVQEDPDDRPTMMTIVSYFTNHMIELPSPREPTFFLRHRMDSETVAQELSSISNNVMSLSSFLPR